MRQPINLKNLKRVCLIKIIKPTLTSRLFLCLFLWLYLRVMLAIPLFISGAEIAFIMFILVMVFGADKIPEIARGLGKGMRTLRNASNDIKSEIQKSAEKQGIDTDVSKDIKGEIDKVKEDIDEITGSVKRRF